jgi:hypothetical protein
VALAGDHDGAVVGTHDEGLVSGRVPRGGNDQHPGEDLGFAVELLLAQAGSVDQFRQRVAVTSSCLQLDALGDDRPPRQLGVPAAVVEVEMAVDHDRDIVGGDAGVGESGREGTSSGAIVGVDLGVGSHPAVHENQPVGMFYEVAEARLHPGGTGTGLFGRAHEVPKPSRLTTTFAITPSVSLGEGLSAIRGEPETRP